MAIYHMSAKVHSRSTGASAVARAAYRAREALVDERTGERHDYSKRTDLDHAEILAPEDAPEWAGDRSKLWNAVEAAERRKDAQVARELQIALPVEMTQAERQAAVTDFLMVECVGRGMVADVAYHGGEGENPHAHVLLTTRGIGPEGFGKKERAWNARAVLEEWREEWAGWANRSLERTGERIDHRSLEAQRDDALQRGDVEAAAKLDREPTIHLGRAAPMEARGIRSERGDELERIDDRNRALEDRRGGMRFAIDEAGIEIRELERSRRPPQRPQERDTGPSRGGRWG